MKKMNVNKKFEMNKQTIANLQDAEMKRINGGGETEGCTQDEECAPACPILITI